MNARKLPDRFPLDKEDGEKLNSDFRKQAEFTGKFTAGLVGGLAVLGAIISFFLTKINSLSFFLRMPYIIELNIF